ncbi:adenylate cyclase [Calothrix sp. NIES-4071]|nr:adenylate cyclase [Calothrix sp. NIES-4071]BAZ61793.1 adenylate cyclase [Calothrix sp. NIES-4105]
MKYQVLNRIFNKYQVPRKFERLEVDANFKIISTSDCVERFAQNSEQVIIGEDVRQAFPEFIGSEDVLLSILDGQEELFEIEAICRSQENQFDLYIDIYILGEKEENNSGRLIILIEDVTSQMLVKQRLSQQLNETNLLSSVLTSYKNYMDKIITSMADALIVTTKFGKIKKVNRSATELFGYTEAELIEQPISILIDDNQLLQQAVQQRNLFKKYFQNVEVICRTKTREKILVAFSCSVIEKKVEGLEDIVYVGRDITTRRRRQQHHGAQFAVTRILSESASISVTIPKIIQAICENLGWDLGELWTPNQHITMPSNGSLHSYVNPILRCVEVWSSRTVAARSFKSVSWQTTYTTGVGLPGRIWSMHSPLWIRDIQIEIDVRSLAAAEAGLRGAFGFPILDDNQIFGVMTFFSRDVQTPDVDLLQLLISVGNQIAEFIKRKHAEEALLESEERYRDLFENANDLIQSVTFYGKFIYVNRAWCETLGYSENEVTRLNMFEIIHPEYQQHFRSYFCRVLAGEKIDIQTAFLTSQGEKVILEGNISCKFVDNKPVATRGIFRNITRRVATETALRQQQEQTERLLLNILPETIANRLKKQPGNIAENFTDVSVLFADIVDFTKISSQLSAIQLVNLLNQIFSAFDHLSEYYGLEKIKTIGDAYMVVGGLPKRRLDHAYAIACMALDMHNAIRIFNIDNHQNFNIRIGIHSGSVVAGVIGIKKFTYDLWGDTVNIASRMESHGLIGKIQVSEATYNLLRDEFIFEARGEIEVKGKGKMATYLLIGKREM